MDASDVLVQVWLAVLAVAALVCVMIFLLATCRAAQFLSTARIFCCSYLALFIPAGSCWSQILGFVTVEPSRHEMCFAPDQCSIQDAFLHGKSIKWAIWPAGYGESDIR